MGRWPFEAAGLPAPADLRDLGQLAAHARFGTKREVPQVQMSSLEVVRTERTADSRSKIR